MSKSKIVKQPKFKIGEWVDIVGEPGHYGIVIMSIPREKKYLVECFPGAVNNYEWIWMSTLHGVQMMALNFFEENMLKKKKKKKNNSRNTP
jgi:hypothetical protein